MEQTGNKRMILSMGRQWDNKVVVAVDYDDTIARHGKITKKGAWRIRKLSRLPIVLVLWTCRDGKDLDIAFGEMKEYGLTFDYINNTDGVRCEGRKINADVYIDNNANDGHIRWMRTFWRIRSLIRKRGKNDEARKC